MPGDYIITMVFRTDGHDISRIFAKKKKKKKKKKRGFILTCTFGGAISLIRGIALYIWVSVYIHIYV